MDRFNLPDILEMMPLKEKCTTFRRRVFRNPFEECNVVKNTFVSQCAIYHQHMSQERGSSGTHKIPGK